MAAAAALVLPGQRAAPARTGGSPTYIALDPADGAMYVPGGAVSRLSAAVITFAIGGTAATGQYQPLEHSVAVATSQRGKAIMKMSRISVTARIAAAALATALAGGATLATAGPASADGVTPAQLTAAGWTCIQPHLFPALLLCAPPGTGLPPLPGTPGFADRAPSYEFLVFQFATGAFLGTEHLLRPDIYQQGTPPCPQQPSGQFLYNPRNDLWFCNRLGVEPSS